MIFALRPNLWFESQKNDSLMEVRYIVVLKETFTLESCENVCGGS